MVLVVAGPTAIAAVVVVVGVLVVEAEIGVQTPCGPKLHNPRWPAQASIAPQALNLSPLEALAGTRLQPDAEEPALQPGLAISAKARKAGRCVPSEATKPNHSSLNV